MVANLVDDLVIAIKKRWSGSELNIPPDEPLGSLGKADVERPPSLKKVLGLQRSGRTHAVIALVAVDDVDLVGESFARMRDDILAVAHYVATHLNPPSLVDNVHLWVVAPPGKEAVPAWRRLRQDLHQDTWSVPKSVWLPGQSLDADAFLDQGLLARPWDQDAETEAAGIDLMDCLARKLGSKAAPWAPEQVRQLLEELRNESAEPAMRALSLIDLAERLQ